VPGGWRVIKYANRRAAIQALKRQDFDVFHPTLTDSAYYLDLLGDKPLVITIHDMIPFLYGEYYQHSQQVLTELAGRAARIITVSENTRADVLRLLPVAPERVSVVHHGHIVRNYAEEVAPAVPDEYLLFIGKRDAYKNFSCLIEAFGQLRAEFPALHLVCAGGGAFTPDELELMCQAGVDGCTHQFGYLSDGQLNRLYRGAQAFVFPSHYEGFGFPILEAFGQHCPVVLSRASCFPEIAQDAALYFDPSSAAELSEQLRRLLHDPALRQQLTRRGQARVRDFTWAQTVADTCRVYEEARADVPALVY
jgi:glycosyltransferase involved in cell wall biosynthesis